MSMILTSDKLTAETSSNVWQELAKLERSNCVFAAACFWL